MHYMSVWHISCGIAAVLIHKLLQDLFKGCVRMIVMTVRLKEETM